MPCFYTGTAPGRGAVDDVNSLLALLPVHALGMLLLSDESQICELALSELMRRPKKPGNSAGWPWSVQERGESKEWQIMDSLLCQR